MRYTQPVYESTAILQINDDNKATKLLQLENIDESEDLSQVIELLRSKEFLKRTFNKLPLNIRYYVQGTFLSSELYRSTPYIIGAEVNSPVIYNVPVFVYFKEDQSFNIGYKIGDIHYKHEGFAEEWLDINGGKIKISIKTFDVIRNQLDDLKKNEYFFIIKNPNTIINEHLSNLNIYLLNRYAKTITINYNSKG